MRLQSIGSETSFANSRFSLPDLITATGAIAAGTVGTGDRVQSSFYRDFYKRDFRRTGGFRESLLFTDFPADLSETVIV